MLFRSTVFYERIFDMKRILTILLSLCLIIFLPSCAKKDTNDSKIKIYLISGDNLISVINDYNLKNNSIIDVKLFDDPKEMNTKLSNELMAGKGPDLFYLDNDSLAETKIYEQIKNGYFADLNSLEEYECEWINNSNLYNSTVLDAGLYGKERYFIPINFTVDVLAANNRILNKYKIKANEITFSNISSMLTDVNKGDIYSCVPSRYLFVDLIKKYVDFKNESNGLNKDSFKEELYEVSKLYKEIEEKDFMVPGEGLYTGKYLFAAYSSLGENIDLAFDTYSDFLESEDKLIAIHTFSNAEGEYSSSVNSCVLVNKNTSSMTEVIKFINYLLSDEPQKKLSDESIPINLNAFTSQINKVRENDLESKEITRQETEDFLNQYEAMINNVNICRLENYYYFDNIVNPSIDNYISKKTNIEEFDKELIQKTQIYFDER